MSDYTRVSIGKDSSGRSLVLNQRTLDMFREVERLLGRKITIVQGSYRAGKGAEASAGTHDKGGVIDVRTWDMTVAQRNLMIEYARQVGFAAWYRTKKQGFDPHSHWVAIGDEELHYTAEDQVEQYLAGKNGLKGRGKDDGPDGYRSMTWEKYKAAHPTTGNTATNEGDLTVAEVDRVIAHLDKIFASKGTEGSRYADLKGTENRTYAEVRALRAELTNRYGRYEAMFAELRAELDRLHAELAEAKAA